MRRRGVDTMKQTAKKRRRTDEPHGGEKKTKHEDEKKRAEEPTEPDAHTEPTEEVDTDPYLLKEATYLESTKSWKNKQRTLVFCTRGISGRGRHLMQDIRRLMPHHRAENKWEKKQGFGEIAELCQMSSCNNFLFFEARRGTELYMWVGRAPAGPTFKCQVLNVHTLGELRMTGNCLLHSRPLLSFDSAFQKEPEYKLLKELFTHAFGTPRNHPKSKPFFDHVFHFSVLDHKIWFRHYQISPTTDDNANDPKEVVLTEIGPRFVMDPIRLFDGCFGGRTLWKNEHYITPRDIRVRAAAAYGRLYIDKKNAKEAREAYMKSTELEPDNLSVNKLFGAEGDEQSDEED
eukprot:Polyplicarium_translucidae@DN2792_c0_g1_i1.p1